MKRKNIKVDLTLQGLTHGSELWTCPIICPTCLWTCPKPLRPRQSVSIISHCIISFSSFSSRPHVLNMKTTIMILYCRSMAVSRPFACWLMLLSFQVSWL